MPEITIPAEEFAHLLEAAGAENKSVRDYLLELARRDMQRKLARDLARKALEKALPYSATASSWTLLRHALPDCSSAILLWSSTENRSRTA